MVDTTTEDVTAMAVLNSSLALPSHRLIPVLASSQTLALQKKNLKIMSQADTEDTSVFYKAINTSTYMQGVSDATIPVVHTILNINDDLGDNDDDTKMFGVDLSSVLNFPQTKEDQAISIGLIQTSLANLETAATTASDTIQEIKRVLEEAKKLPLPTPEKEETPGAPKLLDLPGLRLVKKLDAEPDKEKRARLIQHHPGPAEEKRLATKRMKAIKFQVINSSWRAMRRKTPESVIDAISMVLYIDKTTYSHSVAYNMKKYLARGFGSVWEKPPSPEEDGPQETKPKRIFAVRNTDPSHRDIMEEIATERLFVLPILRMNSSDKTIDLDIPVKYVSEIVGGLSKWDQLFGYSVHFQINITRGTIEKVTHVYVSLELDHSGEEERTESIHILLHGLGIQFGNETEIKWTQKDAPKTLFGTMQRKIKWTSITADVTRVYINSQEVSKLYHTLQREGLHARDSQSIMERRIHLSFGEANDDKMHQLFQFIATPKLKSPVDFVTDHVKRTVTQS